MKKDREAERMGEEAINCGAHQMTPNPVLGPVTDGRKTKRYDYVQLRGRYIANANTLTRQAEAGPLKPPVAGHNKGEHAIREEVRGRNGAR